LNSVPLGANAVPGRVTLPTGTTVPFNPLKDVAFHALDHAYSLGYVVVGICALAAAALALLALGGRGADTLIQDTYEEEQPDGTA
jgi:hypothetical protein